MPEQKTPAHTLAEFRQWLTESGLRHLGEISALELVLHIYGDAEGCKLIVGETPTGWSVFFGAGNGTNPELAYANVATLLKLQPPV